MAAERVLTNGVSTGELFAGFSKSDDFLKLYAELYSRAVVPLSGEDYQRLQEQFAGAVFQSMAYRYLETGSANSGLRIISPGETLQIYMGLNPHANITPHPFGMDALAGISVPNGLGVSKFGRVTEVYEYTLKDSEGNFDGKSAAFDMDVRRFGEVFSASRLVLVVPRSFNSRGPIGKNGEVELPFTRQQFRRFLEEKVLRFSPYADTASVADLQNEARFQRERALSIKAHGFLSKEMVSGLDSNRQKALELS